MNEQQDLRVAQISVANPDNIAIELENFIAKSNVTDIVNVIPITVAVPKKVASMFHQQGPPEVEYQFRFIIIYVV